MEKLGSKFSTSFQNKIISCILSDRSFTRQIYDIMKPEYFDSEASEWLVKTILKYFNEFETDVNLKISIVNDSIENNVFNDNSGNYNYGFAITDYKPKFNNETLSPQKTKRMTITKTSTTDGAF